MIKRRSNVLGQQRLDVPFFRAAESSISNDFDVLAGKILAGDRPLVVRGFAIAPATLPIDPTKLQLLPAGGAVLHSTASEPGTIFSVAANASPETLAPTNARMRGSFAASATNYVGIDFTRAADDSTIDVQKFLDATTLKEISESVALAITLDYVITVSTLEFSVTPSVCPIAVVTTDGSGNATAITDARNMLGRLASGGSSPSALGTATWPQGRTEGATAFTGGDKATSSFKNALDTMMYRLWEIGGGQQWFSACSDRDLHLDYGQPVLGNGDNFDFNSGTNTISWGSLTFQFANSPVSSNKIADGSAVILDGQCLYVDIDRANIHDGSGAGPLASLVPAVGTLTTLGSPQTPGTRVVLAWRAGSFCFSRDKSFEVGRTFTAATTSALGLVQLSRAPGSSTHPLVIPLDANGQSINTATGGNSIGYTGTGIGTGSGVKGTGGATSGIGVFGVGGAPNGIGVKGTSIGTGDAVLGDASNGTGVGGHFTGGGNSSGVTAFGAGTGSGAAATSGNGATGDGLAGTSIATNGNGVVGTGAGTGSGVKGTSGNGATGDGVTGASAATNGNGVIGTGAGTGAGVKGVTTISGGVGVLATAAAGGVALKATTTGNATGLSVDATAGTGNGVTVLAGSAGDGVTSTGGAGRFGLIGNGGTGNATGVLGQASGTLNGVDGRASNTAASSGVIGRGSAVSGGTFGIKSIGNVAIVDSGLGDGLIDMTGAATGTASDAVTNAITQRLLAHAWGDILDSVGVLSTGSSVTGLEDGANIFSVTTDASDFIITLATPMANGQFAVAVTSTGNNGTTLQHFIVHARSAAGGAGGRAIFRVRPFDAAGTPINPATGSASFTFTIHGRQ